MISKDIPQTVLAATTRILRPLIKILLRYGVSYSAFSDLSKQVYFDVAKAEFVIPGKKQTSSRISTMTGLSRKEVARLEALPESDDTLDVSRINRAARVISGWVRDVEFNTIKGEPADLSFDNDQKSFSALVKRYSGDITARTIADELTRTGAITVTSNGLIHLESRAYIPNSSEIDKLTILGTDVPELITTIDYNLSNPNQRHLQRKVSYNYIPIDRLPDLKINLTNVAQSSLETMDNVLSKMAVKKSATKTEYKYARVGVGIYYFEGEQS